MYTLQMQVEDSWIIVWCAVKWIWIFLTLYNQFWN